MLEGYWGVLKLSGFAADVPARAGIDIDDDELAAVHEFELVEHPSRIELRHAASGHVVIRRPRTNVGDQPAQRQHLPLCRRFAPLVLAAIAVPARGTGRPCRQVTTGEQLHQSKIAVGVEDGKVSVDTCWRQYI